MKKIGCLIVCRYSSSRLPGKILYKINNKSVIDYIYERVNLVFPRDNIVICTSSDESDLPIIKHCKDSKYLFYRGDLQNVAKRFLECSMHYGFDYSVRINGDNIFVDSLVLSKMKDISVDNDFDLITNVPNRTFPIGMSIEILRTQFLSEIISLIKNSEDKEHVTKYIYDNDLGRIYQYKNYICPQASGIHLAIDENESFDMVKNIINKFLFNHITYNLPEIYKIYSFL